MEANPEKKDERHKFLMGSLYALGGLLKVEAKSYLQTIDKYDQSFKPVCELTNTDNKMMEKDRDHMRILSEDDMQFFKHDFHDVVTKFIDMITLGLEK